MNKITKLTAIALLTITAGTTLTACGGKDSAGNAQHKIFEPAYDKDLTPAKVFEAVSGNEDNETTDLKGKVIKAKVERIGKGDSGIQGYVLEGSPKDENGENQMTFIPDSQGNLKYKKGDTAYLKITDQTNFLGLVVISCTEVTK